MRHDNGRYNVAKDPDSIHHYIVMDEKTKTARRVLQKGHWVYVRRTEKAECRNGIYLPERSRDDTLCCEVIAIGDRCSQFRKFSKKMKNVVDFSRHGDLMLKVGDIVLVPESCEGFITRSNWNDQEFMIDCGVIKCVLE